MSGATGGALGVDGVTVDDLDAQLRSRWPEISSRLLDGTYEPQPVRRAEIPKVSGGVRPLGVPTEFDRLIQQAVMQVLHGNRNESFSDASYGFQPGRYSDESDIQMKLPSDGPTGHGKRVPPL